jgi:hypothetical protein
MGPHIVTTIDRQMSRQRDIAERTARRYMALANKSATVADSEIPSICNDISVGNGSTKEEIEAALLPSEAILGRDPSFKKNRRPGLRCSKKPLRICRLKSQ